MGRKSKLSAEQKSEVERRLAAGEGVRALAREFGLSPSGISRGISQQSQRVRNVAEQLAAAQNALAALPIGQQYNAQSLAAKLRAIGDNLASAAELGAKTAYRLHSIANAQSAKVDDAAPMVSAEVLQGISALTKIANDSASIALSMMSAHKGKPIEGEGEQRTLPASVDEFV